MTIEKQNKLEGSIALKKYFNLKEGNFPVATEGSYRALFNDRNEFNTILRLGLHKEVNVTFHFKDKGSETVNVTDLPDILKPRALKPFFKWLRDREDMKKQRKEVEK